MTVIGLPDGEADRLARLALTEDLSLGADVTTVATVAEDATDVGEIVARAVGVPVAGGCAVGAPVGAPVCVGVGDAMGLSP